MSAPYEIHWCNRRSLHTWEIPVCALRSIHGRWPFVFALRGRTPYRDCLDMAELMAHALNRALTARKLPGKCFACYRPVAAELSNP